MGIVSVMARDFTINSWPRASRHVYPWAFASMSLLHSIDDINAMDMPLKYCVTPAKVHRLLTGRNHLYRWFLLA